MVITKEQLEEEVRRLVDEHWRDVATGNKQLTTILDDFLEVKFKLRFASYQQVAQLLATSLLLLDKDRWTLTNCNVNRWRDGNWCYLTFFMSEIKNCLTVVFKKHYSIKLKSLE